MGEAVPKEKVYDAYGPDMYGVEVSWGAGDEDIAVCSAFLDDQGRATGHAPRGTVIAIKLNLAGVDRLISVLERARRRTFVDPPSREVVEFAAKVKNILPEEQAKLVDELLGYDQPKSSP